MKKYIIVFIIFSCALIYRSDLSAESFKINITNRETIPILMYHQKEEYIRSHIIYGDVKMFKNAILIINSNNI